VLLMHHVFIVVVLCYRVGSRSHTVEIQFGGRACGGSAKCVTNYEMGESFASSSSDWGPVLPANCTGSMQQPSWQKWFLS
jgi:hypothetical protein